MTSLAEYSCRFLVADGFRGSRFWCFTWSESPRPDLNRRPRETPVLVYLGVLCGRVGRRVARVLAEVSEQVARAV